MAKLHSTGLHEPTGLRYLIAEGYLTNDPNVESYTWTQQTYRGEDGRLAIEEVLRVDHCVVWSRHGTIKRVFNLDIEEERILHAFATSFLTVFDEADIPTEATRTNVASRSNEAALVVVLKTQAHIYCLSGAIYVLPLSFEAVRAVPFTGGCLLQPGKPPVTMSNEFDAGQSSAHWPNALTSTSTASFLFEGHHPPVRPGMANSAKRLPTYCITDLLSDIGLVAATHTRRPQELKDQPLLSSDEELLYMSTDGHIDPQVFRRVCVAVTLNRRTSSFTIWQVELCSQHGSHQATTDQTKYRKRQSSNIHERSRVTSARVPHEASRESLGGLMQSFVDHEAKPPTLQLSNIENLAAELGQDFEPSGVQTRSARRISSMLARTDLAPANDRPIFNDNTLTSRKSLSRTIRKEGSFGSITERNSFGGRRSFPATTSVYSNTTSFLDAGNRLSVGEGIGPADMDELDFDLSNNRLERGLTFSKLRSFACHEKTAGSYGPELKVLVIPHPSTVNTESSLRLRLSVCIHEGLPQLMTVVTIALKSSEISEQTSLTKRPELKAIQIQKGTNIADASLISDGSLRRLLILTKTSQGDDVLHLEAPWSPAFRLDLPHQHHVHKTYHSEARPPTPRKHDAEHNRVIQGSRIKIARFSSAFNLNNVALTDNIGRMYDMRIDMQPQQSLTYRILQLCKYVLPGQMQDSMLVAYWEISRWLETQDMPDSHETSSLAVTLFSLAVPFINALQNKSATPGRRKKAPGMRSSSGPLGDCTSWAVMQAAERARSTPAWPVSAAWTWLASDSDMSTKSTDPTKKNIPSSIDVNLDSKNVFLVKCTDLAKDFLQSPAGESMTGPEGYLPTAMNQERNTRRTALASIVVALYLLHEELKLEALMGASETNDCMLLCALITQLSSWLNWPGWTSFMQAQLPVDGLVTETMLFDKSIVDDLDIPSEPFLPSSIFEFIEARMLSQPSKFHTLLELVHHTDAPRRNDPLLIESIKLLPRTTAIVSLMSDDISNKPELFKDCVAMPDVIAAACQQTIRTSRADQPSNSSQQMISQHMSDKVRAHPSTTSTFHTAMRDVRIICNQALDAESLGRWDASSEMDRQAVTRLIFNQDRRFQEASKIVNQARPPEIEYEPQPNWTEADTLEAQKLLTQYATRRTFAVVSGRGMMHYNARTPLLTEMVPRAQFSMQCLLRSKVDAEGGQSMTFSADRTQFTEDKVSWAFFHNGASAGLMISKDADFIDTSWILYNKPPELTNRHAGFLLALGLNGHLKTLAKWVAFKYLTPKHTMTSVGLLLGLAASFRGTADTLVTRLLSVHVTCLLPPGAAELNLSPLTQTTGIIGVGLLYHDSEHRRMSEVMLSEIECQESENRSGDEPILRDEGYRLAAGISLGLINLGHGLRLHGLHDMRVVERLLAIAVGTKNVNLVHVLDRATAGAVIATGFIFMKTNDISIARKVDVPDTLHQFDYVRPDMFLLRTLARHLIMWDGITPNTDFVQRSLPRQQSHRADLKAVKRLVTNDLPFFHAVAGICFAIALRFAGSQRHDARDLLVGYLDQFLRLSRLSAINYDAKVTLNGIRNCLDILALSCATVMAGSGDLTVYRRLRALHGRIDKETPFGSHLAAHMAIGALFLSGGTATFGTSNLAVAALVISFYPLFPTDVLDNKGHLQALRHLWVMAVENRCLVLRDAESGRVLGNMRIHVELKDGNTTTLRTPGLLPELDSIRSISVLSDDYWPVKQDLDGPSPSLDDGKITTETSSKTLRDFYKTVSPDISISLQRRPLYNKEDIAPFDAELQALDQARGVPDPNSSSNSALVTSATSSTSTDKSPLEWVFNLPTFSSLDHAEQALVLTGTSSYPDQSSLATKVGPKTGRRILEATPIDTALSLDVGTLGPEDISPNLQKPLKQNKLWQLRILLALADRFEQEEEQNTPGSGGNAASNKTGLRKQVVEKLRWRVWKMAGGDHEDGSKGEAEGTEGSLD